MLPRILVAAIARTGRSITGLRGASGVVHNAKRSAAEDLTTLAATSGAWTGRTLIAEQEVDRLRSAGRATDPTNAGDPRAIVPTDTGVDLSARLAAQRADER